MFMDVADVPSCRVSVFIDWQNCYRSARDAFGFGGGKRGAIRPLMLARRLAGDRLSAQGTGELTSLKIYSGQASQKRNAKTYAANRRQFQSWRNSSEVVDVVTRTLDYSLGDPREKGIDVKLAVDLVRAALVDDDHDVAIVVSADTDLLPALELVVEERGPAAVEVATWEGPYWAPSPLGLAGETIRQHRLNQNVFDLAEDTRDYIIPTPSSKKAGKMGSGGWGRRRKRS